MSVTHIRVLSSTYGSLKLMPMSCDAANTCYSTPARTSRSGATHPQEDNVHDAVNNKNNVHARCRECDLKRRHEGRVDEHKCHRVIPALQKRGLRHARRKSARLNTMASTSRTRKAHDMSAPTAAGTRVLARTTGSPHLRVNYVRRLVRKVRERADDEVGPPLNSLASRGGCSACHTRMLTAAAGDGGLGGRRGCGGRGGGGSCDTRVQHRTRECTR